MKVLLSTLHAKYVHASLALPYLASACRDIPGLECEILEMTVNEQKDEILAKLYAAGAEVVLFSCYLWNTEQTLKLASDLKQLRPETEIVLGGPEVSYGAFDLMQRNPAISCIVRGEGDASCRELLYALCHGMPLDHIAGITHREGDDVIANPDRAPIANLDDIPSPFALGLADLAKPLVYVETSRGCPFSCAFCMSSLEKGVRSFSPDRIWADLSLLMEREVRTVKLVDRTFNYDAQRANEIWRFILQHNRTSRFHFEIAADLLTDANLELLRTVPPDLFRFEIGVQSAGEETLAQVERRSHLHRLFENVRRLRAETAVTVHLDLVAGLPGEDLNGFLASLQGLLDLEPDHIQVEPLKVMKGTRMRVIAREEGYAYSETAPYKILHTPWLTYAEVRHIEAISRLVEGIYNSGRFSATVKELGSGAPLSAFFASAAAHFEARGITANLPLTTLFEEVWEYVKSRAAGDELERLREALTYDYCLVGYPGGSLPSFFAAETAGSKRDKTLPEGLPQARNGERVRYYRRRFARDYRQIPWVEEPADITFIYRSAPGEGLRVQAV
ncbi:B12-binding domain-containing radical SAM protein [Geomesophilobacter sediminis]|uniref:DUF4080 domain-containing protein n=1 Tax=Geomesophilobacter sediminis TaxID=2798584 RepID=A0A8J7M0S5_9BACT|nr:B12-binding domain-containing radical SAM protein [Geomesophilobacter sediminis]MBJ6726500.1 DUF4080 domain-containing protein [Geomesophilobacter sediminis]